jgi:hypothetical protein
METTVKAGGFPATGDLVSESVFDYERSNNFRENKQVVRKQDTLEWRVKSSFYRDLMTSSWSAEEILGLNRRSWPLMIGGFNTRETDLSLGKSECLVFRRYGLVGPNDTLSSRPCVLG